ncbi:FAD-dependent oxidoreductase [Pelagibacterium halotolerans]|uniref:Putative dichlorophenol monooxygenase/hydroxylase n=1 Tax=Pelagibacterium halotolerans (strain DSM 22347 / JCM 15775 / CGMCC 1.7692 / B2) TaxID=1082931 RepID=G4RGY7_PELHB|nr:FAD-dependent monooxygenase [Pelagibacterium halotolerans]AEQ53140.1 putative dichlorophenol monooxygenase/hydroxylase [Pelagibacterium halotolerans B2]QJR17222.1 FAD-dependent monooxygenase [Pelagibacterium halotolerans]SEA88757.1 2,4-dichlorophenol 6-monooxygenase [Pelagibacterium halotolerans]
MLETEVLIVGSGPAGSSAAALLSSYGVDNILVTKYRWLADTPRAHITNQRTMEVLRDLGLEAEAMLYATPNRLMGTNVFCTSLAGEELGRMRSWGSDHFSYARHRIASPTEMVDLPQTYLEPILFGAACARGTKARLSTEYLGLVQDEDGVTATVRDRVTGETYQIRARYLIGADGGRSQVAEDIGLPMDGKMGVGGSINIVFKADLSRFVAHRPSALYWVLQPGSDVGGIGMGLVRMVRPWNEWLIVWGYDINDKQPEITDAYAREVAHSLIGDDTIPVEITSVSAWTVNHMSARKYSSGRVFCMGDAVHRHPPSNGLGSNTSIQDAFNLAWKLAMVLKGAATPALLDSYTAERAPIGKQIVNRANKSIGETAPIFKSLGLLDTNDPEAMIANMESRKENTQEGRERRKALRDAIAFKRYEFDAHGVEMNQRYDSSAIITDGAVRPDFTDDPELVYQQSAFPGARLPHAWIEKDGRDFSTLDATGHGRFTILTGIGGAPWIESARTLAGELGIEIHAVSIGPDQDYEDNYGDWARAREVEDHGVVLVRPDHFIAWRSTNLPADPTAELRRILMAVLGR